MRYADAGVNIALADQAKQVRQRDVLAIAHEVMRRGTNTLAKEASPVA